MKQRTYELTLLGMILVFQSGCLATRPNATTGGLLGGATGGIVGAAMGTPSGNSDSGALIGAVAGGLTGAAIGNQADEANLRAQKHATEQAIAAQNSAVTLDQVIQMTGSGLSDELIANQIKANGVAQRIGTNDIILLKNQGVSESVILQLQTTSTRPIPTLVAQRYQAPTPLIEVSPYCPPPVVARPIFRRPPVFVPVPAHRRRHGRGFHY